MGTTTLADLLSPGGAAVRLAGELVAAGACLALIASLFLPWYELPVAFPLPGPEGSLQLPRPDGSLTGWEAFRVADVLLALLAGAGLVFLVTARALGLPVLCALTAAAGWGAVAVVLYGHFRPSALGAVGAYSAPPSFGFFVALCAGGGMLLGSQLAFVAAWASGMRRPISR
jgi:hypothetical protein